MTRARPTAYDASTDVLDELGLRTLALLDYARKAARQAAGIRRE